LRGDADVLRALLAAGVAPHHREAKTERSLLHCAIDAAGPVSRSANVPPSEWRGEPASASRSLCVTHLLEAGADFNARDEEGVTPLHLACCHNQPKLADALLAAGASASLRDCVGLTAVHGAAGACSDGCLDVLSKHGAIIEMTQDEAEMATNLARACEAPRGNQLRCLALLIETWSAGAGRPGRRCVS
jgi:ankyrin repeat protein